MSMGMSMGCFQMQTQRQDLRQDQKQDQLQFQSQLLSLRLALLQELRGVKYTPTAKCPKCSRILTPREIIGGFNNDPSDFTTACTGCGTRFDAKMVYWDSMSSIELPFYCSCQTLEQLRPLASFNPDELQKKNPAVYHSAIIHHGTLRGAFAKINMRYKFDEVVDWKPKILPFLGRLPDTVIAGAAGVSAKTVAALRRKNNIPTCTKEAILQEMNGE